MKKFSHLRLTQIERSFQSAWTGVNSTPFLVDAPISQQNREDAEKIVVDVSLARLFNHCPTLATWAVLTPLAQHYGDKTLDVYAHISRFVREDFSDPASRDALKRRYRQAARKLGLPVSGSHPTELFFAPLGPARSQHIDLAVAFVSAAFQNGPPAIEDTPSARAWQRRAVYLRCPNLTRLRQTIAFDQSAHCARRFEAWRQGQVPLNESETSLFEAYDRAVGRFGRSRQDLTGPPKIFWTGNRLGIEAEKSRMAQHVKVGPFPTQIAGGSRIAFDPPWAQNISWTCGGISRDVPLGPAPGEVLIFDADSGTLLERVNPVLGAVEVAAERLVALSAEAFTSLSFGDALPAIDSRYKVAWISPGQSLTFEKRTPLSLNNPRETAIWIDGQVLGRAGSRALMTGDATLILKLDPEIGGNQRIIRARIGEQIRYATIETDADGLARIPFSRFAFDPDSAPGRTVFEVLAPGAAGDPEARSELSVTTWLWPGIIKEDGELKQLPRPENFNASRSAGLRADGGLLHVDLRTDIDAPILGLDTDGEVREFVLKTGAETLVRTHVETGERTLIPRQAQLTLGHEGRHDTLLLRSSDADADLLILGYTIRRPFCVRSQFEINAEMLDRQKGGDDRIALKRKDGRTDILARVLRIEDPSGIRVEEDENYLSLSFTPQIPCDAVLIRLEASDGSRQEGELALLRLPVEASAPAGVTASNDPETHRISIQFDKDFYPLPTRALFWTRSENASVYTPLEDASRYRVAIGLGTLPTGPDQRSLVILAGFLANPVPPALENQINDSIGHAYRQAFDRVGKSRMVGAIRPVLDVCRLDGAPPRHDLVGIAPWVFEAAPHAFQGLSEGSGLAGLNGLSAIKPASNLPDPEGDAPLAQWIKRLNSDPDLPAGLNAAAIRHGFRALRFRLKESDLRDLTGDGRLGKTTQLIYASWSDTTGALRSFDTGGGGDDRPARIATAIERFARAAALRQADPHINALAFRTGMSRAEIGISLTLMLRAGIELFVHFLALWSHAREQKKERQ